MGDCGDREVVRKLGSLLLHEIFEKSLPCRIVGEGEVELLLHERLDKLLVHFPWLVGGGNHSNSILLF